MRQQTVFNEILSWAKYLLGAVIAALILNKAVIVNAEIISASMESTIMTDSRVIGLRLAYIVSEPQRFDIIVFKFPDDETSYPFVKRIIGLPNEKVEIIDGKVYINDAETPLDDSFTNEPVWGNFGPYFVPENSYFVLGDNRSNSHDSRGWTNKFVAKDKILGKVFFEYFPKIQALH